MFRQIWRPAVLVTGLGLVVASVALPVAQLQARATVTTIASGLANPRGLNFGPDGALYVAEAGRGPEMGATTTSCILGSDGLKKCYGATGGVRKIVLGAPQPYARVVDKLPSIAPVGMNGNAATGAHDVDFQGLGNGYVTIGLGAEPDKRDDPVFASVGSQFGRLVRFKPNGKWSFEEDLAQFEQDENPDASQQAPTAPPDSNPYGVLALPGRVVYADAGGNALNQVAANGVISNLAVFPPGAPGFVPPFQAVPTSVTVGPDRDLYVGQLTGGPFPIDAASVWRVPAYGGTPVRIPGQFTKIIDIAFGKDGELYVLEISTVTGPGLLPFAPPGALLRVPAGGGTPVDITPPVQGGFNAPGGIAVGKDGALYITVNSISATQGSVIKVVP